MQDEEGFLLKPRCRVGETAGEVPRSPGYYSIFIENPLSLPKALSDRLLARNTSLIYVGLATTSLRKRLVDQDLHHQGPSTFFRTIGAVLGRLPVAGSLISALNQNNYKFNEADTDEISSWIHQNLWVNWRMCEPARGDFEKRMIGKYRPVINTTHNPDAISDLKQLRIKCRTAARNPPLENDEYADRPSAASPSNEKATNIQDSTEKDHPNLPLEAEHFLAEFRAPVRARFLEEMAVKILEKDCCVFFGVSPTMVGNMKPVGLISPNVLQIISEYWFVEGKLDAPLMLQVRGDQEARLSPCPCTIPSLNRTADSLNHAFTLISEAFETKRRSHSGNVFERVYTQVTAGKWHTLDEIRIAAIAKMQAGTTSDAQAS